MEEVRSLIAQLNIAYIYFDFFSVAAPVIDPMSNILTIDGSSITLSCTSRGSPPDKFTLMKNGVVIPTSIVIEHHTNNSAVFRIDYTIHNITAIDGGKYTCSATNPIGSDSKTITVAIIGIKHTVKLL